MAGQDHQSEIDELYSLPLSEFTAARNRLAARCRDDGDHDLATSVKQLAKPGIPAWAVNRVYWCDRDGFDRLLKAGAELRDVQVRSGSGDELRRASRRHRAAVAALLEGARAALEGSGHATSPAVMKRVETTLEALAAYGQDPQGTPPGRLSRDLEPPGFEYLMQLTAKAPRSGKSHRKGSPTAEAPRPDPRIARARADLAQAEKSARDKRAASGRAASAHAALSSGEADARDRLARAERELHQARFRRKEAADKTQKAAEQAEKTEAEAERAERSVKRASEKLRRLTERSD